MTAKYGSREIKVTYYNGAGYVVREDLHPCTKYTPAGPVTRQGRTMLTGIRQGLTDAAGFKCTRNLRWPWANRLAYETDPQAR